MKKQVLIPLGLALLAALFAAGLQITRLEQRLYEEQHHRQHLQEEVLSRYREALEEAELSLSKLPLAEEPEILRRCLYEADCQSRIAAHCLSRLEMEEDSRQRALFFLQSLSAYSREVCEKAAQQLLPSQQTLQLLEEARLSLIDLSRGSEPRQELSLPAAGTEPVYPVMIHDGPFSLEEQQHPAVGPEGPEGTKAEAIGEAARILGAKPEELSGVGEEFGEMAGWILARDETRLMLSRKGLHCVWALGPIREIQASEPQDALPEALQLCEDMGLAVSELTWSQTSRSIVTLCLAPLQQGVVLYPDLVKIKIDLESGRIVGLDARRYYRSHTARSLPPLNLDEAQARALAPTALDVTLCRPALIPGEAGEEILCWELRGRVGENRFYVFLEDESGTIYEIQREIRTDAGTAAQ